jgi:FkbM family methyltransferase
VVEHVFTEVSVAGRPPLFFCVDPAAGDPVADWFLGHASIDEPVQRAFLDLLEPGMRVLDLGCHLGTFSLPAAAAGASVLAVDAATAHVELLAAAAERNGLERLRVVHRAISDSAKPVPFVERSIHGHVGVGEELHGGGIVTVAPATVDELLAEQGWDGVDVVKMDIEGMEVAALAGMRALLEGGARPALVFECNPPMLARVGSSIVELRERIVALGYELLMIDHLHPGTLVHSGARRLQAECVCDYVAVASRPAVLAERWRIEPAFTREQARSRLLDTAAGEGAGYRAYAAALLAAGPERLCADAGAALAALRADVDGTVRSAAAVGLHGLGARALELEQPAPGGPPGDVLIWGERVDVRAAAVEELDTVAAAVEGEAGGELVIRDASLHVRAGQLVAVLSDEPRAASALLETLAAGRGAAGTLEVAAPRILLSRPAEGMEEPLAVRENVAIYAAFLGLDAAEAVLRADDVAALAGLDGRGDAALGDLSAAAVAALALAVALELGAPRLLLLERIPPLEGAPALAGRIAALRAAGGAVVQAFDERESLLGRPDRAVWIANGMVACSGHPASVFDARWRARIGLPSAVGERVLA